MTTYCCSTWRAVNKCEFTEASALADCGHQLGVYENLKFDEIEFYSKRICEAKEGKANKTRELNRNHIFRRFRLVDSQWQPPTQTVSSI